MGFVLLLRVNIICLWVVYGIAIFIDMLVKKKYKKLVKTAIYTIIGIMTVVLPCIIILNVNGIWNDFIEEYILFNFKYASSNSSNLLISFLYFISINPIIMLISLLYIADIIIIMKKKEEYNINLLITSLINFLFTFLIVILPGNLYGHYGIILVPTFIIPILWNMKFLEKQSFLQKDFIISLFVIQSICIAVWLYLFISENVQNVEYEEICNYIESETNAEDTIIVLGNNCSIYLDTNRNCCSKYIYQNTLINTDKEFKQYIIDDIEKNNPKIIVFQRDTITEKNKEFFVQIYNYLTDNLEYEQLNVTKNDEKYMVLRLK